jgi:hypothetical protein
MDPFRRVSKNPRSNIVRIGNREIITRGLNSGFWTDLYHRSMSVSWPVFFASAEDLGHPALGGRRRRGRHACPTACAVAAASATVTLVLLQKATGTIPIVFASAIDPVGTGLIASMARPGGNATGFAAFEYSMSAKWVELLKEIAPSVARVAVLWESTLTVGIGQLNAIRAAAPSINMDVTPVDTRYWRTRTRHS